MTRQTINTGTGANSNNGDPLRTAFTKINSNFEELYTLVGSASGNVIDVVGPLFDHADHNNVTVTLDSVNDRIILDAQFSEVIQDLKGSVFADDSSIMVDSVDNKIYASGGFYGDLVGSVFADSSTMLINGTNGTIQADHLVGTLPAIDGSNLTNMDRITLTTLKAEVAASIDFNDFQTRIAAL